MKGDDDPDKSYEARKVEIEINQVDDNTEIAQALYTHNPKHP